MFIPSWNLLKSDSGINPNGGLPSSSISVWGRLSSFYSLLLLFVAAVGMTGCATVPSPQIQAEATVPFDQLVLQTDQYIGRTVTLGGYILETDNRPQETVLTLLQAPLDSRHRPQGQDLSQGRFMARTGRFLDPEVYTRNRLVTITGRLSGVQPQQLGDRTYNYPLIDIQGLYLWPRPERRIAPYYPYHDPYWYGPWYDPWYPRYRYSPFRRYPWW